MQPKTEAAKTPAPTGLASDDESDAWVSLRRNRTDSSSFFIFRSSNAGQGI